MGVRWKRKDCLADNFAGDLCPVLAGGMFNRGNLLIELLKSVQGIVWI